MGTILGLLLVTGCVFGGYAFVAGGPMGVLWQPSEYIVIFGAAFGILVAIPSMIFYRHFRAKVDALVLEMELQALKLVEVVHGDRKI